jgi:single-stranded-DNA-specific exonuclease
MAAGLGLRRDHFAAFAAAFDVVARARIAPELLDAIVLSDGELKADELSLELAHQLRDAGPWGQGFPEPLFDGPFTVLDWRVVGERHLKLELDHSGARISAIEFGGWDGQAPPERVHVAYRLEANEWRDREAVQLVIVHRSAA